jgi:hypothetical protein
MDVAGDGLTSKTEVRSVPVSSMSDADLLLAGIVAKHKCSEENLTLEARAHFTRQLAEVREEWKVRFSTLPLSATFDSP